MGLIKQLFTNCACPQGRMGRAMLKFMNLCHAPLTNWGLKLVNIQDGWTMLDIGCGGGATLQRLLKRSKDAQVYGIDISEESVAKAKKVNEEVLDKQVFVTQGSAEKLPYEDGKFDLVTAVETVYFWPNLPNCLQEVCRVLKSGGKFAIMVEVVDGDSMWARRGTATHSLTLMSQKVIAQRAQFRAQIAILLRLVIPASTRKIRNCSMLVATSAYVNESPS